MALQFRNLRPSVTSMQIGWEIGGDWPLSSASRRDQQLSQTTRDWAIRFCTSLWCPITQHKGNLEDGFLRLSDEKPEADVLCSLWLKYMYTRTNCSHTFASNRLVSTLPRTFLPSQKYEAGSYDKLHRFYFVFICAYVLFIIFNIMNAIGFQMSTNTTLFC